MNSYIRFAEVYDSLTSNVDYKEMARRFDELILRFGGRKDILLDLACGTGNLAEEMAKLGYDVIGTDISQEMLTVALDKKYDSGLPIQYLCQDMRKLDMFGTVDVTVCTLDSLNHLPSFSDIEKTFERVSLFSYPKEALFIFDMNTVYKHKHVLSDNTFVYDNEDVFCVWQNEYSNKDNRIDIYLDFFEKNGELYERFSETITEKAYDEKDIISLLEKTGFELLGMYDDYSDNPPSEKTERILFVARKK